jgi:hypothetical protein
VCVGGGGGRERGYGGGQPDLHDGKDLQRLALTLQVSVSEGRRGVVVC